MTDYAPFARIILRYLAAGSYMGSEVVGGATGLDPDMVEVVSILIGVAVEFVYARARKFGGAT